MGEWQKIKSAPDGRKIIVICPVLLTDGEFYEPEISYRNGDYWFKTPGERMFAKPSHWMPLPPAPPDAEGGG